MTGRVLVTGASGFVGRALVNELSATGWPVLAAMRKPADIFERTVEVIAVSDLTRSVEWRSLLQNIDLVIHLAGIAHAGPGIAEETYDRINRLATAELAAAASTRELKRLIFVSSIRAQTGPSSPRILTEADAPTPTDAYGRSKLAAEAAVRSSNVPYTILRPVLVYGEGAKGNLASLAKLAQTPWPLPFGLFNNQRSLLARQNLIHAILHVLVNPRTAGEIYVVADSTPIGFCDLVKALRIGMKQRSKLLPVPPALIRGMLRTINRNDLWERLYGSLVVDSSKLRETGWNPTVETRAGLAEMARISRQR